MILLQLSRAKDHICSFADLGNHSAFLCLRTLPVECKNLTDKMTNADEDKVFRLLEHLNNLYKTHVLYCQVQKENE